MTKRARLLMSGELLWSLLGVPDDVYISDIEYSPENNAWYIYMFSDKYFDDMKEFEVPKIVTLDIFKERPS